MNSRKVKLVLVGLSGAGKTSIAERLKCRSALKIVDIDEEVSRKTGKEVSQIIRVDGEQCFRKLETEALETALKTKAHIIALGAGGLQLTDNRDIISANHYSCVWIDASDEVLCERLDSEDCGSRSSVNSGNDINSRPLLNKAGCKLEHVISSMRKERSANYSNSSLFKIRSDWLDFETLSTLMLDELALTEDIKPYGLYVIAAAESGSSLQKVTIGKGVRAQLPSKLDKITGKESSNYRQIVIITDSNVSSFWLRGIEQILEENGFNYISQGIDAGETSKTVQTVEFLADKLIKAGVTRDDVIVALGGGVVGDIAGFLASIYMRGIEFVQIPSTIVAQVDSALGGKTGVDLPGGKNLLGTFFPAGSVIVDVELLTTLPEREFISGMAEVIKYGAIRSVDFINWLDENAEGILNRESAILMEMIERSVEVKLSVVKQDPLDKKGIRAALNFGHTIGHAIERITNYRGVLHGEGVAIGMSKTFYIYRLVNGVDKRKDFEKGNQSSPSKKLERVLSKFGLPLDIPAELLKGAREFLEFLGENQEAGITQREKVALLLGNNIAEVKRLDLTEAKGFASRWYDALKVDKKRTGKDLTFVFVDKLGHTINQEVEVAAVLKGIAESGK